MYVPAARLEVVNVATPLDSVSLPSVPFWSLKVTVPPLGVAPPAVKSLTVAVKVTDWPWPAAAVEAISAVAVGAGVATVNVATPRGGEVEGHRRGRDPAAGHRELAARVVVDDGHREGLGTLLVVGVGARDGVHAGAVRAGDGAVVSVPSPQLIVAA